MDVKNIKVGAIVALQNSRNIGAPWIEMEVIEIDDKNITIKNGAKYSIDDGFPEDGDVLHNGILFALTEEIKEQIKNWNNIWSIASMVRHILNQYSIDSNQIKAICDFMQYICDIKQKG